MVYSLKSEKIAGDGSGFELFFHPNPLQRQFVRVKMSAALCLNSKRKTSGRFHPFLDGRACVGY
jgi:hypothetical protein